MPTVITRGAASAQGYGYAGVKKAANYIEDVFSTYLYTGNGLSGGQTQNIQNNIDLSTKGGMVWIKSRSSAVLANHGIFDTARGAGTTASNNNAISSSLTAAEDLGTSADFISAFNTNGFTVKQGGTTDAYRLTNLTGADYVSWTFRKQAKFFDVVTFTSSAAGVSTTINHSLGSSPGCVIVKALGGANENWWTWHRSLSSTQYLALNTTAAAATGTPTITVSSTQVVFGANWLGNASTSYVAYLFAHDAGGFGAAGTDNVISCGSFTMDGSGNPASVTLGYEPQLVIAKRTDTTSAWYIEDNMRGMPVTGNGAQLYPNTSGAEAAQNIAYPNATGFTWNIGVPSATYIYIAIRRGPMKTPTSGTSVFSPVALTPTVNQTVTTGFPVDLTIDGTRSGGAPTVSDRLRGSTQTAFRILTTNSTGAEQTGSGMGFGFDSNTGIVDNGFLYGYGGIIYWNFRRAPGFFDVVCYTGTGVARTVSHNLGVAPELMIVKSRSAGGYGYDWAVYSSGLPSSSYALQLNLSDAQTTGTSYWNATAPTSSVFTVGAGSKVNGSSVTYVAYLFATVAGVSKVGSYTGSGTTKQIDCGFTGGARFVLIKRTDSTGDWYVWDTARGIVAANDPYLLLNSTAAEVTNTDYIDTYSAGFEISSTAPAAINANGGSFIFLAIA